MSDEIGACYNSLKIFEIGLTYYAASYQNVNFLSDATNGVFLSE